MKCPACGVVLSSTPPITAAGERAKARKLLIAATLAVVLVWAFLSFTGVNFLIWMDGGFAPREHLTSVSPDRRFRVSVNTRVDFPASGFLDSAILVSAELTDSSGRSLDALQYFLWEGSDFGEPKAEWAAGGVVTISNLERRHGFTITLGPRQWSQ